MSNYKHLADIIKVCSILPIFAVAPAMAGTGLDAIGILDYNEEYDMYTMNSNGSVGSFSGYDASDRADASVIFVEPGKELYVSDGAVIQGNKAQIGGAIAITGKTPAATLNIGKGVKFLNNTALFDGGAIGNYGNTIVADGVLFQENKAQLAPEDNENQIGGGAISLGSTSKTTIVDTDFIGNESGYNGGAIGTRLADTTSGGKNDNSAAVLKIFGGDFIGNKANGYKNADDKQVAGNGGAIYNTFWTDVVVEDTDFEDNYAANYGGAIYNDGTKDKNGKGGVMTVNDSDFEYNTAGINGGAIYNTGKLTIVDSDFVGNSVLEQGGAINSAETTSELYISKSKFESNEVIGDTTKNQLGGAIKISGIAEITDTDFINNYAKGWAGAIYAGNKSDVKLSNVLFQGNTSAGIGALGLYKDGQLKNVRFIDNHATDFDSGALFLGAVSSTSVDGTVSDSYFEGNSAATIGGAIGTRSFAKGDNKDAYLDIKNTKFVNNVAGTNGGAIANSFYHSYTNQDAVYVKDSQFVENKALNGGAVYNHGSTSEQNKYEQVASIEFVDTTFTGNNALVAGGAIYNEEGATVILSGKNVFTGNTEKGALNDIHNLGTLNVTSGTTSIGGGITGNGTLNVAKDATLNINSTVVKQGKINIDGAIVATILSEKSFGRFDGDVTLGKTASLDLTVGSVGKYDIFDGSAIDVDKVDVGNAYTVKLGDEGEIVIETKDVKILAADTGLSESAAGAVAGLANSTDKNIQQISLLTQQALATGDVKTVERETAKLNPESKPVAQSVATSVQTQVLNAVAGRMSGNVQPMGRAGGDGVRENGFWAQGLFNKSKLDGQFHGYTRGFALGGDVALNRAFTIGAGFAYNNSDVHADNRGHTEIDANTLFAYAQYKPTNWFVNGTLTYTMAEYTENVEMFGGAARLTNAYDVDSYGAQAMTGYEFGSGITTQAGLRYLHVAQEAYSNGINNIGESDTDFLTGVAGVKYAFVIQNDWTLKLRPELRAAVTYDFISDEAQSTVTMPGVASYVVDGERLDRLGGEVGIGLTALYNGVELSLMYDLVMHKDYTSQTGMIKFRGRF